MHQVVDAEIETNLAHPGHIFEEVRRIRYAYKYGGGGRRKLVKNMNK